MSEAKQKDDLRARTKEFAGAIIDLFIALDRRRDEVRVVGNQMLRSGTSVAAQYREASRARSPEEFISKIDCCAQETDETQLWLELLTEKCSVPPQKTDSLIKESNELISIFVTMSKRTKANKMVLHGILWLGRKGCEKTPGWKHTIKFSANTMEECSDLPKVGRFPGWICVWKRSGWNCDWLGKEAGRFARNVARA
jgi:four helix bundle protein